MRITAPVPNASFVITAAAEWLSMPFTTDGSGAHNWNWEIKWGTFRKSGIASTATNTWDASDVVTNLGGTLSVRVTAGTDVASVTVTIKGTNPIAADVTSFLNTKPNSDGFDKILQHESGCRHFDVKGEPIKSFDNGYGMCQLTTPVPSYEQVWNWKMNVEGGLSLFSTKRRTAITYLSQSNRSYTQDQLRYETVCRWNGGSYHEWDATAAKWVRHPNILCDSKTGNIGWDMTDPENAGKTEAQLHARDKDTYRGTPPDGAHWKYSGVCYADSVLG